MALSYGNKISLGDYYDFFRYIAELVKAVCTESRCLIYIGLHHNELSRMGDKRHSGPSGRIWNRDEACIPYG